MKTLSIDIETYSGVDITKSGVYPYVESPDFEILLFAYAFDNDPVECIELAKGEEIPLRILYALQDSDVEKRAFNAQFERVCLSKHLHLILPIQQWYCTMCASWAAGFGGNLDTVGKAIGIAEDKQKIKSGKLLINYFSKPCRQTKKNGGRTRNLPSHNEEKWQEFVEYCKRDVEAEREISRTLDITVSHYMDRFCDEDTYILDQRINDVGIEVDKKLIENAIECNNLFVEKSLQRARELTRLENPNSVAQLKKWIKTHEGIEVESLSKDNIDSVIRIAKNQKTKEVLKIRKELSKTSIKKYQAMLDCCRMNGRVGGLLQYYGASRTGRWAGRLIQVQNLPKNKIKDLDDARLFLKERDYEAIEMLYPSTPKILSQLVRTAFVAKEGHTFIVADYSAIEARVIAWLANETWRQEVFASHGKIYEASASQMFNVSIDSIKKGSELRAKGKIAELALGYGGGVGALLTMGAIEMGLKEEELQTLVDSWRSSNRNIVSLWYTLERYIKNMIQGKTSKPVKALTIWVDQGNLIMSLPSLRPLYYQKIRLEQNRLTYMGMNQTTRKYERQETYGGKLTENIVQAIARDCLAHAMKRLHGKGYSIVMHVHDEVVIEVPEDEAEKSLKDICSIMGETIPWAKDLLLRADGYITKYYKKD